MANEYIVDLLGVELNDQKVAAVGPIVRTEVPNQPTAVFSISVLFDGNQTSLGTDDEDQAKRVRHALQTAVLRNFGGYAFDNPQAGPEHQVTFGLTALRFVGPVQLLNPKPELYGFSLGLTGGAIQVVGASDKHIRAERENIISIWKDTVKE